MWRSIRRRGILWLSLIHIFFGSENYNRPSRFLDEIPEELFEQVQVVAPVRPAVSRRIPAPQPHRSIHAGFGETAPAPRIAPAPSRKLDKEFKPYQRVKHAAFGEGTVLEVNGAGSSTIVVIDFVDQGIKRFAAAYAPITPIEE